MEQAARCLEQELRWCVQCGCRLSGRYDDETLKQGLPKSSRGKTSPSSAGGVGLIPGWEAKISCALWIFFFLSKKSLSVSKFI